ncbi:permease [Mycobacterium sp. IS-1590]|uniref:permease n=1 Tax=Mycobacterium sp. IS-1590 TaxID=1772286 RepID=UPI000749169D|nr:permease [Mycobacterium sp. IS-1590]KUI37981.1 permease [Mycobacterium sp. IS-1590]
MVASNTASLREETRRTAVAGLLITAVVGVGGLTWAKWVPYVDKALDAARTHHWPGSNILRVGGVTAGDAPSWHAATTFFHTYVTAIWPALVVALVLSACVQAFMPRRSLPHLLNRGHTFSSAAAGGVASMPSMMCACCSAPVAVTLQRSGVHRAAAVAYWLGNPLLNPAVLVFLVCVAPWQWTATRLVVGVGVVVGGSALVARIARRDQEALPPESEAAAMQGDSDEGSAAVRFVRALFRLSVVLIPEYLILVLAVGAGRGWLLQLTEPTHQTVLVVVMAAVIGTLIVIPTAGEIPILQGLALLGVSSGVLGALLITLPAASLPGIAMVARSFGWRTTYATAAMVVVGGVVGAVCLSVL